MDNTYFDLFDDDKFYLVSRQQYQGDNTKFDVQIIIGKTINHNIQTTKEWVVSTGKSIMIMEYNPNNVKILPSVVIENNL